MVTHEVDGDRYFYFIFLKRVVNNFKSQIYGKALRFGKEQAKL